VALRRRAKLEGFSLIEGTAAWAEPGGLLQLEAFEDLRDEILDQLRAALPVDGVILGLHGAMVAQGCDDCEGNLLERVRAIVGPKVVVAAELGPQPSHQEAGGERQYSRGAALFLHRAQPISNRSLLAGSRPRFENTSGSKVSHGSARVRRPTFFAGFAPIAEGNRISTRARPIPRIRGRRNTGSSSARSGPGRKTRTGCEGGRRRVRLTCFEPMPERRRCGKPHFPRSRRRPSLEPSIFSLKPLLQKTWFVDGLTPRSMMLSQLDKCLDTEC
jgi:hypothetical protein